jgi:hypothetical protein
MPLLTDTTNAAQQRLRLYSVDMMVIVSTMLIMAMAVIIAATLMALMAVTATHASRPGKHAGG